MKLLICLLLAATGWAQTGMLRVQRRASPPSLSVIQTCIAGKAFAAVSCGTTSNSQATGKIASPVQDFVSGKTLVVFAASGDAGSPLTTPTMVGPGCPSSLTAWGTATGLHGLYHGVTQSGACEITETPSSTGNYAWLTWWVTSPLTTFDAPAFVDSTAYFSTPAMGASETPAADGSLVLGSFVSGNGARLTGLSGTTFTSNQFNNGLTTDALAAMTASFVQSSAAAAQVGVEITDVIFGNSVVTSAR